MKSKIAGALLTAAGGASTIGLMANAKPEPLWATEFAVSTLVTAVGAAILAPDLQEARARRKVEKEIEAAFPDIESDELEAKKEGFRILARAGWDGKRIGDELGMDFIQAEKMLSLYKAL